MKRPSWSFYICFMLLTANCSFISHKFADKSDAIEARSLTNPHVDTFRFPDLVALRKMLEYRLKKYRKGVAFLSKEVDRLSPEKKLDFERKLTQLVFELDYIEKKVQDLRKVDQNKWKTQRPNLNKSVLKLIDLYQQTATLIL